MNGYDIDKVTTRLFLNNTIKQRVIIVNKYNINRFLLAWDAARLSAFGEAAEVAGDAALSKAYGVAAVGAGFS